MCCILDLGSHEGLTVRVDLEKSYNKHLFTLGSSGTGKSTENQKLMSQLANSGCTIMAINRHHVLDKDQIYTAISENFENYSRRINVPDEGVKCNLFSPICFSDETNEIPVSMINGISEIICASFHLTGSKQFLTVKTAVEEVYYNGYYIKHGLYALDQVLKTGRGYERFIAARISELTESGIFTSGDLVLHPGRINIFEISNYTDSLQSAITQILMAYIWRQALAGVYINAPIYLFLDEVQGLSCTRSSIITKFITEGRKFGVNLILATQMLDQESYAQTQALQSGLVLFFKPALGKEAEIARMINPEKKKEWIKTLSNLGIGEFVAVGNNLYLENKKTNKIANVNKAIIVNGHIADKVSTY